jgi:hypothetical protein
MGQHETCRVAQASFRSAIGIGIVCVHLAHEFRCRQLFLRVRDDDSGSVAVVARLEDRGDDAPGARGNLVNRLSPAYHARHDHFASALSW